MKKLQWEEPILESLDCSFAFKSIADFLKTVGFLFLLGSYSVQVIPRDFSRFYIIVSITGAFLQYVSPITPHCLILPVHANSKRIDLNGFKSTISSRARTMTRYNFRRFSTQMYLYKAFFLLHISVTDTFEFKETLCLHSLNCIGIQIAFIFKLNASLTCLFDCRTIFPTFPLMIFYFPDSKYWHSFQRLFPHSILRSSKLIGILSSIFLRRHCNISFSETSVAMLDFIVTVMSLCLQFYHVPPLFHEN